MEGSWASTTRPRRAWAGSRALVFFLLMVLLQMAASTADWDRSCPPGCKCTYVSNRKVADCRSAGFSTVPTTLSPEVQELNLANNNILYLEKDAFRKAGLVNLQKLYLRENNIRSVHKDAFRELRIMIELDLSGNKVDKLHPDTFTGLEKLRVLDLSGNDLFRLEGRQFPHLPHLRKLDFSENNLNYIHNYAFSALPLLTSLRLSGNKLKLVHPELFSNNSNLVELELHDNLWECDCNLKNLVRWVKKKSLLQEHVTCHSPERVSGRRWESVSEEELACRPELIVSQTEVPAAPGQNASLTCRARGEPLPQVKWVLQGRVLTNMSLIPFSTPEQRYVVREVVEGGERWSQLTVTHVQEHDLTYYTCVADNLAGLVEHNVSLIAAAPTQTGAVAPKSVFDLYVIIGIVAGGLVLLVVLIVALCCCWKRRKAREMKQRPKVNGVAGGGHVEHKNVMIVNPVEKPPRQYEQVPQTDIEMSALASDAGAHRSYDEVDYPEAGPAGHRMPLATLEEEDDDMPSQDTTLPLDTTTPSHSVVVADYLGHYPDLLDMTRPRAVSPTQLSYHSLVAPQFTTPDYRYSYVHPTEYVHYPVAYVAPQPVQPRPGYVTLPRRHRSPSWAGQSSFEQEQASPRAPLEEGEKPARVDPIYDTLGPRTTADGTSRTDLTRPALRAAEPFTPRTPQSPGSPPSLPTYYAPVGASNSQGRPLHQRNHSSTLPRSTPNLLDGGLTRPLPHQPQQPAAEGVAAQLVTTRSPLPRLPAHSPTPSNASTARTASPSYRAASPALMPHLQPSATPLNGHATSTPSGSPLASSNESTLDSSQLYNNNNNNNTTSKMSDGTGLGDLSLASVGSVTSSGGKKVPPKPPPKPSAKRLSVASTASDSRKSSVLGENGRVFQDEGPDGTEV